MLPLCYAAPHCWEKKKRWVWTKQFGLLLTWTEKLFSPGNGAAPKSWGPIGPTMAAASFWPPTPAAASALASTFGCGKERVWFKIDRWKFCLLRKFCSNSQKNYYWTCVDILVWEMTLASLQSTNSAKQTMPWKAPGLFCNGIFWDKPWSNRFQPKQRLERVWDRRRPRWQVHHLRRQFHRLRLSDLEQKMTLQLFAFLKLWTYCFLDWLSDPKENNFPYS